MKRNTKLMLSVICFAMMLAGCGVKDETNDERLVPKDKQIAVETTENKTEVIGTGDDNSYVDYGQTIDTSDLSDNIIIAVASYPSYGEYYDCLGAVYKVMANHELVYYIGSQEAGRCILEDSVYDELISKLDFNDIATVPVYVPDPTYICDGGSNFIYLYGKDDKPLVTRGGYCVDGEEFWDYYKCVTSLVDRDWENKCFNDFIERQETLSSDNEEFLLSMMPELKYADSLVEDLMSERNNCGRIVCVSVPVIIDEEKMSIIVTDDNGNKFLVEMFYTSEHGLFNTGNASVTDEERDIATKPITYQMLSEM